MAQLADEILSSLDPQQRSVATALKGPVCVILELELEKLER